MPGRATGGDGTGWLRHRLTRGSGCLPAGCRVHCGGPVLPESPASREGEESSPPATPPWSTPAGAGGTRGTSGARDLCLPAHLPSLTVSQIRCPECGMGSGPRAHGRQGYSGPRSSGWPRNPQRRARLYPCQGPSAGPASPSGRRGSPGPGRDLRHVPASLSPGFPCCRRGDALHQPQEPALQKTPGAALTQQEPTEVPSRFCETIWWNESKHAEGSRREAAPRLPRAPPTHSCRRGCAGPKPICLPGAFPRRGRGQGCTRALCLRCPWPPSPSSEHQHQAPALPDPRNGPAWGWCRCGRRTPGWTPVSAHWPVACSLRTSPAARLTRGM